MKMSGEVTLRWLRSISGALVMACFVFGVGILFLEHITISSEFDFLRWSLPILAGLFVLMYMPQVLYMWALRMDALEKEFYEVLATDEVEEIDENEEDDDDKDDFPLQGYDGKDIPKKFN